MKRFNKYLISIISAAIFITVGTVSAFDESFYSSNNIQFYDPAASNSCTYTSGDITINTDYDGNPIFSSAQLDQINSNKPFYEIAGTKHGVPWQVLAAIHLRESNLKRSGPSNGDGPYQIVSKEYTIGDLTDSEFQQATDDAAEFVKGKTGDRDLSDPENIKYLLFAYNGMAKVYKDQAKNLGFTDEQAENGEGSPYVMNRYDLIRDPTVEPTATNNTWGQIKVDYGDIDYPANTSHHGAFVYYSALTGIGFCDSESVGSSGDPRDAQQVQAAFASYMKNNANKYGDYYLGYNGCTTLSNWYIGTYTNLTYGRGNGEKVVENLLSSNSSLKSSTEPRAPSIFSVKGGLSNVWGASGVSAGHVGVVLHVDSEKKEATVLHTGSKANNIDTRSWISTYKYPSEGVTFTYIGDNLK